MTPLPKGSKAERLLTAIRILYVAGILSESDRERAFKKWAELCGVKLSPEVLHYIKPK